MMEEFEGCSLTILIFGVGYPKNCIKKCDDCENTNCKAKIRREISNKIEEQGHIVQFLEDFDLPVPAIDEKFFIKKREVDLVFILPESQGSQFEFSNFMEDSEIAPKLRIFVERKYHPLDSNIEDKSLLSNGYLVFLTQYGHVYSYNDTKELFRKVLVLCESFAHVKIYKNL